MDEIEDQNMQGISQREEEKLIQIKEGKGIQEEEGLTKSKLPNLVLTFLFPIHSISSSKEAS